MTVRIHSEEDYLAVEEVSELLFDKNATRETLRAIPVNSFRIISQEIPFFSISGNEISKGINIIELLATKTNITASKGDARRAIQGNSIAVNKDKILSHESIIDEENLLHGRYMMIENGKKNKILVEAV